MDKLIEDKISLILSFSKTLQKNGIPAQRMEETFSDICYHLNVEGDVFSTPNGLIISLGGKENPKTYFVKAAYGPLNFEKLDQLDKIYQRIVNHKLSIQNALTELQLIEEAPKRYNSIIEILFFAISTGSAARLTGGSYPEVCVAAMIGLFVGFIIDIGNKFPRYRDVVLPVSSIFAMLLAKSAVIVFGNYSIEAATISGLIILIPGFSFTVAIVELVNGHAIAGTARLANTMVALLMLGLGIVVGGQIDTFVSIQPAIHTIPQIPEWTTYVALFTVPLGFVVLFKAVPKDFIWIFLACLCSFYSLKLGSQIGSGHLAVFIASFSLGLLSNIFGLITGRPVSILLVPGIILLVPGSIGFQSITNFVGHETLEGLEMAFTMIVRAVSLVAGLVLSNILLSSKKAF